MKGQTKRSGVQLRSGVGIERRMSRSGACREASDGAKRRTTAVVSTTRRLDNGDDGRLGRRGYFIGLGRDGALGMTIVASNGSDGEKSLWL